MRIAIEHVTRYRYSAVATYSVQSLRLTPASFEGQTVLDWTLSCSPEGSITPTQDGFGNTVHLMSVEGSHQDLAIIARGTVEVADRHGVVKGLVDQVPLRVFMRRTELTMPGPGIVGLVRPLASGDTLAGLHALMGQIRGKVEYETGVTDSLTKAEEALGAGHGVCQDHAHIFISACRVGGVPARYVTGYLLTDGVSDEEAHHAWAEAWVEGLGWVGFDVANNVCPTDRYVRLAAALDASYAAPIRGSRRGGGEERLEVEVRVQEQSAQQ
jgi:transglutaminase-like putative cysteine protease